MAGSSSVARVDRVLVARQRTREPRPPFATESDAAEDAGPCVRAVGACAAAPAPLRADSWAWNGLTARSFRSAFP